MLDIRLQTQNVYFLEQIQNVDCGNILLQTTENIVSTLEVLLPLNVLFTWT